VTGKSQVQVSAEDCPVIRWLMTEGRHIADAKSFLESFAVCLRVAGVDVSRITTGVPVLHPQLFSVSSLWEHDKGVTQRLYRADPSQDAILANSPIRSAYDGIAFRNRLTSPAEKEEFPILTELRNVGVTDYVVLPVPFSDGTNKALSLATTRVDGFSDDEIALFAAMMPAVAVNLEIQALRRMARTLLDTYVGRQAGGRVLAGQIRRGMGETINAVIWLSDLRGFTGLSESSPRDELIEILNCYFSPMCDAVEASGGEVLKFIGDSVLAIFPIELDEAAACRRALEAAHAAGIAIEAENLLRTASGAPQIDYGLALHVGDVMYGNIGGDARLDFTVIGPAVNLTSRIGSMCKDLQRSPLLSAEFVRASGVRAELLGEFALKGVGARQPIYGVIE
jgi:adenylate cyclase